MPVRSLVRRLAAGMLVLIGACAPSGSGGHGPRDRAKPGRTLMVAQSAFTAAADGRYTVPDAAVLLFLPGDGDVGRFAPVVDRQSNVFHKAIQYGDEGIITIGADGAWLKLWTKRGSAWEAESIWHPTFGGKHDRLRDIEAADLDGDGRDDLAIATHDQGVVAVVWRRPDGWRTEELDRSPDTFVHEIEVGDLDGNGRPEIYATPSRPNTELGRDQGGGVTRYEWNGKRFEKSTVAAWGSRHAKEILVADIDQDGKKELYVVLEAELGAAGAIVSPVEILRLDWKGKRFETTKVTTLNDRFCRSLLAGDPDGDGAEELVAAAFSSGVWVIERDGATYTPHCIDPASGGFEHAACLADLDGDGRQELYVADDRKGVIRRYVYQAGRYDARIIHQREAPGQAMVWNITVADIQ